MSAKFDWYECSLEGLANDANLSRVCLKKGLDYTGARAAQFGRQLLQELAERPAFDEELRRNGWRLDDFEFREEKGFNYYRHALACYSPQRVLVFRLLWTELSSIHLISSGKRSPLVCDAVRKLCPLHFVTRADSALDFDQAGDWDRLVKLSEAIREGISEGILLDRRVLGRGRLSSTFVLQDKETAGRTYYLGSMKSTCFLRIYDKTIEQRAKAPKHLQAEIPDNWTRAEIVARPADKERRLYLSKCAPDDVWSASPATQDFYSAINRGEIGHMPKPAPNVQDYNKAYWTLLQQYKATFAWKLRQSGGDCRLLGEEIVNDLMTAGLL